MEAMSLVRFNRPEIEDQSIGEADNKFQVSVKFVGICICWLKPRIWSILCKRIKPISIAMEQTDVSSLVESDSVYNLWRRLVAIEIRW